MRLVALTALLAVFLIAVSGSDAQQSAKTKDDPKTKTKADPKAKDAPAEGKFNLKLSAAEIDLGTHLMGPKFEAAELRGHVVLMDYWGVNCPPCLAGMPKTSAMNAELADFGLIVIGSHVQNATPDEVRSVARSHGANYGIYIQARVKNANDFTGLPHVMLFDHTGACIYRAASADAEQQTREAVGKALVDGAHRDKFTSAMSSIVADLRKGKPPAPLMVKVGGMLRAPNPEVAADAKALLDSMTAIGSKKLEDAEGKAESDPVAAFLLVEKLPATYKGTPVATKSTELISKLRKDKRVAGELAARPTLDAVRKLEQQLAIKPGAGDPTKKDEFTKANASLLKQLKDKVAQMKKSWPEAKATEEAAALGEKYLN